MTGTGARDAHGWAQARRPGTLDRCTRHHEAEAVHACDRCKRHWCALCVKAGEERGVRWVLCECGGRCATIEREAATPAVGEGLPEAFAYPFRGEGRWLLVLGTVFFGFLDFIYGNSARATFALIGFALRTGAFGRVEGGAGSVGQYGGLDSGVVVSAVATVIHVILVATLLAWVQRVVRETARGQGEIPGFGEFVSADESVLRPIARTIVVLVVTVGPACVVLPFGVVGRVLGTLVLLAGVAVLPMALTSVAIAGSVEGLDVPRILRSIPRVGASYFFAAALFLAVIGLLFAGGAWLGGIPLLGPFLRAFLTMYLAAVAGRVLGLVYAQNERKLGWY